MSGFTPKPPQPAWPRRETSLSRLFWLTLLACGLAGMEAALWVVRGFISHA